MTDQHGQNFSSDLHQQMGRLVAAAENVRDDVREVRDELGKVRHSQNNLAQQVVSLDFRVGLLDKRLGKLEPTFEEVQTAKTAVLVVRRGLLLAAIPLGGIAAWVLAPIREWVVTHVAALIR